MTGRVAIEVRMSSDLHEAVKAKAASEERSVAEAIRHALHSYVGTATEGSQS